MKSKWIFLSYPLSENYSAYGNGERIKIEKIHSLTAGQTSNNSRIITSSHFGTHIDFPFHFSEVGKKGEMYGAEDFIFHNIGIVHIDVTKEQEVILHPEQLNLRNLEGKEDFLLIKTGFCNLRNDEKYWKTNPGFSPECAEHIKKRLPHVRAIGFDSISLSSYTNRPLGRNAHKKFLLKNDFLIIEDMDLRGIDDTSKILRLICAPLRFNEQDGSPLTVFAEVLYD